MEAVMLKKLLTIGALATAVCVGAVSAQSSLNTVVDHSMQVMGVANVKTLVISGDGFTSVVGQPFNPHSPWWRKLSLKNYVRSIDLQAKGWRIQSIQGEGENPPGGGAGRITPTPTLNVNTVTMVNAQGQTTGGRGQGIDARAPEFASEMEYIMLPVGFLKTALERNATVNVEKVNGKTRTVLAFPIEHAVKADHFKTMVRGWIDERGYVERVATTIDNNVLGDIVWDVSYTDWKDFGGVKFPTHIVQHQGEPLFFDLTVSDVKVNVPVDLTARTGRGEGANAGGEGGARDGATPPTEDLGDGFWLVPGGYAGVFASFNDYVVAIEGPQSDARAGDIIREIKRLAPNKPIRYVLNTHSHFDHIGGLRAFVAEGATIVTNEGNKGYYEKIFANAHTLVPDTLFRMRPQPKINVEYTGDKKVLTDGAHTIEMYRVEGSTHNAFMMMAYLPKQRILIEADEFNVPARAVTATPARINSYEVNLLALIERLKLNVDRIIPIHPPADNRKVAMTELKLTAGKP
jgi:glyoxylase-like metal-dependent hydrolase (beta-lactamase superfamily II)